MAEPDGSRADEKEPELAAYLAERLADTPAGEGRDAAGGRVHDVARWALPFLASRPLGEHRVRVSNREVGAQARTAIEVLTADQPFLVDTFRLCLRRLELRERSLLHWTLAIDREDDGEASSVGAGAGAAREAYLYAEVPLVDGAARRDEIAAEVDRAIRDVRHVVADHGRMVRMIRKHTADIEFAAELIPDDRGRAQELMDFLSWIADDNYVFFGYRWYPITRGDDGERRVSVDPDSGLGLMRDSAGSRFRSARSGDQIPELVRARLEGDGLVFFDKSRSPSQIHREGRLDCLSVKVLDERGELAGFGRFIGMLTHKAIATRGSQMPLARARRERVLEEIGAEPGSHVHKAAIEAFDSLPPEFLFAFELEHVKQAVKQVLRAAERGGVEIAVVPDPLNRSFFLSVILPRSEYDEELRHELHRLLSEQYGASYIEHRSSFVDDEVALIHFFCTSSEDVDLATLENLERDVYDCASSWSDRFEASLLERYSEQEVYALVLDYAASLGKEYRAAVSPADAALDVSYLERLRRGESKIEVASVTRGEGRAPDRLKIYQSDPPYLTDLLPALDNCGLRVVDATLTELAGLAEEPLWIVTCRLDVETGPGERPMAPVIDALQQVLCGRIESGRLNRLVLGAQLEWPEVDLLRAYLGYAHQLGIAPQIRAAASTLLRYPEATRSLVTLFRVRFDPELEGDREVAQITALRHLARAREAIQRADDDRVFGLLLELILATMRTAFFAPSPDGDHRIVLKLHTEKLANAPSPRPHAEIYVHSAEMSGVHLRGGPVARGGIRWSDRVQDFRREILGLMKTQRVKNGLIVPVGAKGGFVLRAFEGRRPPLAEVDWQYARFIRALLSVTDNVIDGGTYRPANVVAHDGDDPYLVVAADRGTAHLSDVANEVAMEAGYWLGDAFASGGSDGYDHKAFGITARGAWVCARRHFLELGIDPEKEVFTVAGVGDMSGDVFGNGLLLTRRAKLIAAFDGRHVFLDPDPDPDRSWRERGRLFELPRSSWADFERDVISPGGGVFDRSARAVELSPEVRAVLGIAATSLSGEDLVRAVLRMPVDLFWMGGMGTYVKSTGESHADVGDRANDAVRIDASELRARVVSEGANLALTQRARVEFSLRGGRVYTDSIDNSGGVDLSDREVNFKIALSAAELSASDRNRLLRDCADEACRAVLANSASQSRCVSLDAQRASEDPDRMALAAEFLVGADSLDPALEFLPDREALRARVKATGRGYTPPEIAILLGYTKRLVKRELACSDLLDHPSFEPVLSGYFPEALRERYADAIASHPLRREITAAALGNRVIDQAGVTLIPELCSALGVGVAQVIAAYHTIDRLLDVDHLRFRFETQDVPETARLAAALRVEESVRGAARSCLGLAHDWLEPEAFARQAALVRDLRQLLDGELSAEEQRGIECRAQQLVELGFESELSNEIESLPLLVRELGVLSLAPGGDAPLPRVLELHARIGREACIVWTLERLGQLDRRDGWERVAAESLHVELLETQRQLSSRLLEEGIGADALERFLEDRAPALRHIHDTARRMEAEESPSLASLTVLAGQIRRLR